MTDNPTLPRLASLAAVVGQEVSDASLTIITSSPELVRVCRTLTTLLAAGKRSHSTISEAGVQLDMIQAAARKPRIVAATTLSTLANILAQGGKDETALPETIEAKAVQAWLGLARVRPDLITSDNIPIHALRAAGSIGEVARLAPRAATDLLRKMRDFKAEDADNDAAEKAAPPGQQARRMVSSLYNRYG